MAKISIIVPVYNVEKYIIKCIDSLINQTLKEIEIIIVNDGTKDKSIDLVKEKYNDKRIKIFNKENGGVAKARNYGIKKATGDYLFFVDPDDFIELNTLELLYNEAITNNYDLVMCDYYKYYDDNNYSKVDLISHYDENNEKSIVTAMPGPVCKLIKKKIFFNNNIEFLEKNRFEDNAIMPFVCSLSKKSSYINKALYYYVQREGSSLNRKKYDKGFEDIFTSLEYLVSKFKEYNLYNEYYDEIEYIYIEYLLHAANLKFLNYKEGIPNIQKVSKVIKNDFPKWRRNKYYKKESIKYRIMCNLFYYNKIKIINILRRGNNG